MGSDARASSQDSLLCFDSIWSVPGGRCRPEPLPFHVQHGCLRRRFSLAMCFSSTAALTTRGNAADLEANARNETPQADGVPQTCEYTGLRR